jgi:NitT/TauT family transport system permease protein
MARPLTHAPTTTPAATTTARPGAASRFGSLRTWGPPALALAILLLAWEGIVWLRLHDLQEGTFAYRQEQSYLPYPHKILEAYFANADSFLKAGAVTLGNAFIGFCLGGLVGYALALLMSRARWIANSFYIYIVGSQMVPIIALAPILYGIIRDETILKITVSAYLTFFPVTVNVLRGLSQVDPRALDLMQSYAATPWEIYRKLRIPAAMPFLFNALKIASTGSLIGAIVAELMGGNAGLGVLILTLQYNSYGAADRLWALILEVGVIGLLFFGVVSLAERLLVPWQPEFRRARQEAA